MRPLLVDLDTEWRGGQNQFLLMLKGFHARGHRAELLTVEGAALGNRARALGLPVHAVAGPARRWRAARHIRGLLGGRLFDVVHVNESHALTAAWLARAHREVPLVISRRVGYPLGKSLFARMRFSAATRIIANSRWVAEQAAASGANRKKLVVVYEGVEIPPLPPAAARSHARARWNIPENAPLLGSVAVLSPDKGQEYLIRALGQLRAEFSESRLLLAGDGPCRSNLERISQELGIRDAVIFAGFVKDIEAVYAALDVFLFPVFFEGLGTSLLAAMACAIPSIAFNCCALGEIIENEKSGLLVETANVEEIRKAAARLLRDRNFARRLGEAGRGRIEEVFSADRMVEEMLRVYAEALR